MGLFPPFLDREEVFHPLSDPGGFLDPAEHVSPFSDPVRPVPPFLEPAALVWLNPMTCGDLELAWDLYLDEDQIQMAYLVAAFVAAVDVAVVAADVAVVAVDVAVEPAFAVALASSVEI